MQSTITTQRRDTLAVRSGNSEIVSLSIGNEYAPINNVDLNKIGCGYEIIKNESNMMRTDSVIIPFSHIL
jgi:hypothetical protein